VHATSRLRWLTSRALGVGPSGSRTGPLEGRQLRRQASLRTERRRESASNLFEEQPSATAWVSLDCAPRASSPGLEKVALTSQQLGFASRRAKPTPARLRRMSKASASCQDKGKLSGEHGPLAGLHLDALPVPVDARRKRPASPRRNRSRRGRLPGGSVAASAISSALARLISRIAVHRKAASACVAARAAAALMNAACAGRSSLALRDPPRCNVEATRPSSAFRACARAGRESSRGRGSSGRSFALRARRTHSLGAARALGRISVPNVGRCPAGRTSICMQPSQSWGSAREDGLGAPHF